MLWKNLERHLTQVQCLWIAKGRAVPDIRRREGLAATIVLRSARLTGPPRRRRVALEVDVTNRGTATWRTERGAGCVSVGVQLLSPEGALLQASHGRLKLLDGAPAPGQSVLVQGTVPLPELPAFVLRIDLVSELVAWFGHHGLATPVLLQRSAIEGLPG